MLGSDKYRSSAMAAQKKSTDAGGARELIQDVMRKAFTHSQKRNAEGKNDMLSESTRIDWGHIRCYCHSSGEVMRGRLSRSGLQACGDHAYGTLKSQRLRRWGRGKVTSAWSVNSCCIRDYTQRFWDAEEMKQAGPSPEMQTVQMLTGHWLPRVNVTILKVIFDLRYYLWPIVYFQKRKESQSMVNVLTIIQSEYQNRLNPNVQFLLNYTPQFIYF